MDMTEACYVYEPRNGSDSNPRPKKKRKTKQTDAQALRTSHGFLPLLEGVEHDVFAELRAEMFESIWAAKAANLEDVLSEANSEAVDHISAFIEDTDPSAIPSQIAAGLVTSGLATSSSGSMFAPVARRVKELDTYSIIPVPAADCPNLKTALKTIIRNGTDSSDYDSDDDDLPTKRKSRLLNFDLQLLQEHHEARGVTKCILFFQNSEALDGYVLGDLVDVLTSWQDRLPIIVLFEIAVSVDLFQEKLSRSTIRQLRGTSFESKSASEILDLMFRAATSSDDDNPLYLGAGTSKLLLDRQEEHIQSAKGFISALKYMYMTHFFNNALSVLLCPSLSSELQPRHIATIRRLKSFNHYIEDLSTEDQDEAEKLKTSDSYLASQALAILARSRTALLALLDALEVLHIIHEYSSAKNPLNWSSLYTKAMAGQLAGSPLFRELLLTVKKISSDNMQTLLGSLLSIESLSLGTVTNDLDRLISLAQESSKKTYKSKSTSDTLPVVLRSASDPSHSTTRTTVVAQKISLTKEQSSLSTLDADYTRLSSRIHSLLRNYFASSLLGPIEIPLSEVLIFDAKSAVTSALGGAPRANLERSMASPGDYLDCECCKGDNARGLGEDGGLTGTEPATSVVWQLIQEAGATINIEDLWNAFVAVVTHKDGDEEWQEGEEEERNTTLTLFYRALAELKYLGVIKNSRKKADHIMKLRWKGI